jgi:hypothetical protein
MDHNMSETIAGIVGRVRNLPYGLACKSDVACEREYNIVVDLVVG